MIKKISLIIPVAAGKKIEDEENLKNLENIQIIVEKGKNPSANRNRGVEKAKTELVAFINAHSILAKDWLSKTTWFFEKYPNVDIVGGPQLSENKGNVFERASGYALDSVFGSGGVIRRYKPKKIKFNADEEDLTSANLICRKKVFRKVMFDESLWPGEDPKFVSDAKKAGFKIAYSPDIIVYNKRRKNAADFARQIFNYGLTRAKKENISATLKKPFFLVPVFFTLYLGVFLFLTLINNLFMLPLIIYIILAIFFSAIKCIKNKDFYAFFPTILIFLTIHVSYGLGFIHGKIRKEQYEGT